MANLLEALQPKMEDTTSQLSTLLRAKSGKALAGPATALSTQQEQAALAQTAQQMQPVQAAAQTQAMAQEQQTREVEQRAGQQQTEIAQAREANKMQTQLRTDQLLQELEQGRGRISLAKYQSNMEQIAQTLRFNNQQYTDTLQREGNKSRLQDNIQFTEQLARAVLEDNKMILEKQLGNKSILAANDREFAISMAKMGITDAWQLLNNAMKSEKEAALFTGLGTTATAGVSAYGKYTENTAKRSYYNSPDGLKDTSYEASTYRKT